MTRGRWLLIVGLVLLVGGLGSWMLNVTGMVSDDRADASGYGQFVIAAVGLFLTVWQIIQPFLWRGQGEDRVDEVADRLAVAVGAQWSAAATERGLRAPRRFRSGGAAAPRQWPAR